MPKRVIIVGGGISGLSAAYYLSKAGISSTLIERSPRLGGVIQTQYTHGTTLESGPDSYLGIKPAATELIRELGLGGDIIGSNDHLRVTYIWRNGKLIAMPDGLMMMVPTKIAPIISTPLLGWGTKLRMGVEYLRRPSKAPYPDRSVTEFIIDHYGQEAVDYLAEPLLSGVYGGDPAKLSASSVLTRFVELESTYGSLTRGALAERAKAKRQQTGGSLFRTLKGGLGTLVAELEKRVAPSVTVIHGEANSLASGFQLAVNGSKLEAEHVVLACPAYRAAAIVKDIAPALAAVLSKIEYSSSLTLNLGYEKSSVGNLTGFGLLIPKKERTRLVACTLTGNKFSHRTPDDKVVLRCFFGGATDEAVLNESDASILAIAREELRAKLGVTATPIFHTMARWPGSMAQYTVGHARRLIEIEARIAAIPGLHLAGNAYYGIGIPDCVKTGRDAAQLIIES